MSNLRVFKEVTYHSTISRVYLKEKICMTNKKKCGIILGTTVGEERAIHEKNIT